MFEYPLSPFNFLRHACCTNISSSNEHTSCITIMYYTKFHGHQVLCNCDLNKKQHHGPFKCQHFPQNIVKPIEKHQ